MIFDWKGLNNQRYFILQQKPNPLKHCNYALPFPMPIGLPFMPCDLPNQYQLISSDEEYQQKKQIQLVFEQETSFVNRFFLPASHRSFSMTAKDYYHHIPYRAFRDFNKCFSSQDRPTLQIFFNDRYIGKVVQSTILNCCCDCFGGSEYFQQILVFDQRDQVVYRIVSQKGQRGQFIILPCWKFDQIAYYIIEGDRRSKKTSSSKKQSSQGQIGQKLGGIKRNNYKSLPHQSQSDIKYESKLIQQMNQPQKIKQMSIIRNTEKAIPRMKTTKKQYQKVNQQDEDVTLQDSLDEKIQIPQESRQKQQTQQKQVQDNRGQIVGEVIHLFNGFSQYTSKNDKYGITLPQDSSQQEKCLLIHGVLLIDYILFENF